MGVQVYLFKSLLSILWGLHPKVELLTKYISVPLKGIVVCALASNTFIRIKKRGGRRMGRINLENYNQQCC